MANFEEIANKSMNDIKPPPLLPKGTYLVGIVGVPEHVKSSQKQTDGYAVKVKFYQARDDVDQDILSAALAETESKLSDMEMDDTFWITDRSAFMYKQFLTDVLGFSPDTSFKQANAEMPGMQYLLQIVHKPRQDGSGMRAEIGQRTKAP